MANKIDRTWISGLSSGMDTQGLIDKIIQLERIPIDRLEQKRTTLQFQKSLLQEVNLKLFELQNKATDLTFSRTFASKKVTSTNERLISASANTAAQVGSYVVRVKQLATHTKAYSTPSLAGSLEYGMHGKSAMTIGGKNIALGGNGQGLGVTPGDIQISIAGSGTYVLPLLSAGLTVDSTIDNTITTINSEIQKISELKDKVKAWYDERTDQVKFSLLDTSKTLTVSDIGTGNFISTLYGTTSIQLSSSVPIRPSANGLIRSGNETTLNDLRITTGTISLSRGGGPAVTLDVSGLNPNTTIAQLIRHLNHQLDLQYGWSGNPDDRQIEFRYDPTTRRLFLANKDTGDGTNFQLSDGTSNLVTRLFGSPVLNSFYDSGNSFAAESLPKEISAGTVTIDGVQIQINTSDTLTMVLNRITSSTGVIARYDSATDRISLTRKDGLNIPIGLGAATDTSNFLEVTGLLNGSQEGYAIKESRVPLGAIDPNAVLNTVFPAITSGVIKFTVNGQEKTFQYNAATESLNQVLDRIANEIPGIGEAYFDSSSQKVVIRTSNRGALATLKIEQLSGNLATQLELDTTTTATGVAISKTLIAGKGIAGVRINQTLDKAKFLTPITSGSFTINGVTFTISNTSTTTLQNILDNISNNVKAGVKAEYEASTGRIVLTSKEGGNKSISFGSPTDTSNFLIATGLMFGEQTIGSNAIFSVQGVQGGADIVRASNTVTDVIEGVTLNLRGITDANGETINISADTDIARKAIDDFIKTYNEVTQLIFDRLTEKRNYELSPLTEAQKKKLSEEEVKKYEEAFKKGLLNGDSTLQSIRNRMRLIAASVVKGLDKTLSSLADIGITTGTVGSSYQDTQVGLLKITNEDKLNAALKNNPNGVAALFSAQSTVESNKGIARRLKETLNEFTRSGGILTSRVGRSGVAFSNSEFDKQISLLNEQINRQEKRLQDREDQLIRQFADLEAAISRYQSQSSAFAQQLSQLLSMTSR